MIPIPQKWFKRWLEYRNDKKLAEKCGLSVKEICTHDWQPEINTRAKSEWKWNCAKCGEHSE